MGRNGRRIAALLGVVALIAAAGWVVGRPALDRRHDVAARRSAYRAFPVYPGATKLDERSFELTADGRGTGHYGLTVTYRLPPTASADDVLGFFRQNIPPGWHEASDDTCGAVQSRLPPPPVATSAPGGTAPPTSAFSGRLVLGGRDRELTVFAPGTDDRAGGVLHGVTFRVRGTVLTLDDATFSCEPG
jgi:hypothetical protein